MVIKLETPTERVEPSLMVFDRLADAREDWIALRETADVSPYQNYDYRRRLVRDDRAGARVWSR